MTDPRECGTCSLCCKVMQVPEVDSPVGKWCTHCKPGAGGCAIYDERPEVCKEFKCSWLNNEVPDAMNPKSCKVVTVVTEVGWVCCYVDPGYPTAWREGYIGSWIYRVAKRIPVIIICGAAMRQVIITGAEAKKAFDDIMEKSDLTPAEKTSLISGTSPRRK